MEPNTQQEQFKFFLPIDIQKGQSSNGATVYKIEGKASKERRDSQGETMVLKGMDVSNLKVINWNHKSKDNPDAYLGEVQEVFFKGDEMYFKGELFPEMPMAAGAINLMKALKKRGKQLGVSIEGSVIERGSRDKNDPAYNVVTKSRLTALALTPNPVNSDTFAELLSKGMHTENLDWEFDAETEALMKSFEEGELEKSFSVEENQHVVKEDVEGPKNKVTKGKDEEEEEENKESLSKKISKSDVYDRIFEYFYDVDVAKAQRIYQLIEKIAVMDNTEKSQEPVITEEAINKAFATLEGANNEEDVNKGGEGEVDTERTEMLNKAIDIVKGFISEGIEETSILGKMVQKGYGNDIIEEALAAAKETPAVSATVDNTEVLKSIESLALGMNKKFQAVGNIYQSQAETLESILKSVDSVLERNAELEERNTELDEKLSKSLETITQLNDTVQKFAKSPQAVRKSATSFVDKSFGGEGIQKSADAPNARTYNMKDAGSRLELTQYLTEESGIAKGEGFDRELVDIAKGIEITKMIDPRGMARLNAMGITVLM